MSRNVIVGGYTADLVGFKASKEFHLATAMKGIRYDCYVTYQTNTDVASIKSITEWSEAAAQESHPMDAWLGTMAQLVFPVIVSKVFDPETTEFAKSFEPNYISRQKARIPHPVLIELTTNSVYHRKGMMFGAVGYKGPINKLVENGLMP